MWHYNTTLFILTPREKPNTQASKPSSQEFIFILCMYLLDLICLSILPLPSPLPPFPSIHPSISPLPSHIHTHDLIEKNPFETPLHLTKREREMGKKVTTSNMNRKTRFLFVFMSFMNSMDDCFIPARSLS